MCRRDWWVFRLVAAFAITTAVFAQDGPERGVARLSLINGEVSVRRGDSNELIAGALNAPLVVTDRIYTGSGSRAEVQFDFSNLIRLSPDSEIRLAELEHKRFLLQVAQGTVTYRVLRDQDAEVELSTPNVSVRPFKRGIYRVTVLPDGSTEVTVRSGEAEIFTPRGSERLTAGRTMFARGTQADPEFRIAREIPDDEWDRWNERRDRDLSRSQAYRYVSRDIYGAEDLDQHGRWVYDPPYGYVWAPVVAPGWVPYRHGRWTWIDYYGWSWISYDPWGWAPYHYGRWYFRPTFGWCWWPGGFGTRHFWSPALVAFVGFGRGGFGLGFGNIGWIPLAPYDPFHRWWGRGIYGGYRSRTYVDNSVNIINNVNVTNIYRNARINSAITAVGVGEFGRRGIRNQVAVDSASLSSASLVRGAVPAVPDRESLRTTDQEVRTIPRASDRGDNGFYARRAPAQVERVPFEEQRRGVEQMARRTLGSGDASGTATAGGTSSEPPVASRSAESIGRGSMRRGLDSAPLQNEANAPVDGRGGAAGRGAERAQATEAGPGVEGSQTRAPGSGGRGVQSEDGNGGGWRRFGDPSGGLGRDRSEGGRVDVGRGSEGRQTSTPDEGGWRRFGEPSGNRQDSFGRSERSSGLGRGGERAPTSSPEVNSATSDGVEQVGRSAGRAVEGRADAEGWRRFGSGSRGDADPGSVPTQTDARGSSAEGRGSRGWRSSLESGEEAASQGSGETRGARGGRGDWGGVGRGESIRINPPIVRERDDAARGSDRGSQRGGFGRGNLDGGSSESGGGWFGRGGSRSEGRSDSGRGSWGGSRGDGGSRGMSGGDSRGGRMGGDGGAPAGASRGAEGRGGRGVR
jgi:hypothetical protein